ncbi:bifunctional diguanylate cyclase/phosphodiesterase [Simiduia curdlanivorans]|uniref:EAL domain-containing protein n=1 Tax=Simiduia curdlanivorans TaxID=1492769 RepID=A0ABV8V5X6_9GAMM|nr:bifunctional diguanylate cyclase/phosphodiesterase [Simiduia curdlanivorans]MDN3638243.1 bifunctional diguanylate cyclase/phosphodiesterase [Simiduia curdlanivorans]
MQPSLEAAFYQSRQPQCLLDQKLALTHANQSYCALTGLDEVHLKGKGCPLLNEAIQGAAMLNSINDAIKRKGWWEGELQYQQPGKSFQAAVQIKQLQTTRGPSLLVSFSDISERKLADVKLHRMAYFDLHTQLPNQALLNDRLGQAQLRAKRSQHIVALILFEPDQAESLREQLGVQAYEQIVLDVANRMRNLFRAQDTLASLGQGRFALLMPDLKDKAAAITAFTQVTEKLQLELGKAMPNLQRGISIATGAALYPLDADSPALHTKQAETVLLQAKKKGRGQSLLFTPALQQAATSRQKIAKELQLAVQDGQFVLHYQPLLCSETGAIISAEALIRWQHPSQGLLLPGLFLDAAEATGTMRPIGNWVLRESVKQFLRWQSQGASLKCVNVNLSARQFQEHYLIALVRDILQESKLTPSQLHLEITEAALQTDDALTRLNALHKLGVKLTLDDFGSGLTCLYQLQDLPFDQIKIDRRFAKKLPDEKATKQLKGLTSYLHSLGVEVVMTGIENPLQLEVAQQLDCQAVQGYLLREPASPEDLALT